jgi:hypothetical protein
MVTLAILLFVSTGTVAGYAVIHFLRLGLSRAETLAWSFATGLLLQALIEVSLLAAGLLPGPKKILAAETLIVAGCLVLRRRTSIETLPTPPREWEPLSILFLVLSAIGVFLFFCVAATEPLSAPDFLAIWGLKGRIIFATASIPSRLFHDPALFWAHPEYPLLVPLSFATFASAARAWDDHALAIFYPFCQIATVLVLWGFLSRRRCREAGAVAACLTAVCFPLYAASNIGMAEIPMALGFVLLACAAADGLLADSPESRFRLSIAALFSAATKQEGTLFALLLSALLFVKRGSVSRRTLWLWAGVPAILHGVVLRLWRGPVVRRDLDLTLLAPARWGELLARLGTVWHRIFSVEARSLIVAVAVTVLFLVLTRRGCADWLALPIAGQVFSYAFLCALSAFGVLWLFEGSFRRISISLIPTAALVLGCRLLPEAMEEGAG